MEIAKMIEINRLYTQGQSVDEILELAMSRPILRAELTRLIEQNLVQRGTTETSFSQARYAMRLHTSRCELGARHSEL